MYLFLVIALLVLCLAFCFHFLICLRGVEEVIDHVDNASGYTAMCIFHMKPFSFYRSRFSTPSTRTDSSSWRDKLCDGKNATQTVHRNDVSYTLLL